MEQIETTETKKKGNKFRMQFTKRKKIFILVGMFALLAVTGYLNFTLNRGSTPVGGGGQQSTASFFTTFHAQRADERRSQARFGPGGLCPAASQAEGGGGKSGDCAGRGGPGHGTHTIVLPYRRDARAG